MPSVLYRQAEDHGHRRPGREIPSEVRTQEGLAVRSVTVVRIQRALIASALFICALLPGLTRAESVRVTQVLDGDSFRLSDGREVRLIGINTPEFGKNGKPNE